MATSRDDTWGGRNITPKGEDMKKAFFFFISLICLVCLVPVSGFAGSEVLHHPPLQIEIPKATTGVSDFAFQIVNGKAKKFQIGWNGNPAVISSGQTRWTVDSSGNVIQYDSTGTVDNYSVSDRVVYVTSYTQLSTWSGQASTAGVSYIQLEPGKTYVVDPVSINASIIAKVGGGNSTFSGVTAVLPSAATYSGPAYDTTVRVFSTGATGYATVFAGATPVYVHPYPGSGVTWYGAQGTRVPQTLLTEYTTTGTTNGTVTNTRYLQAGTSYWELDKLGEFATFGLYNGQVSAFVVQKKVLD